MPWNHDPATRLREAATYGSTWRQARVIALRRAGHRCQHCGSTHRLQVDHVIPISQGGTHQQSNLQVLCEKCHDRKTATEAHAGRTGTAAHTDPAPRPSTQW